MAVSAGPLWDLNVLSASTAESRRTEHRAPKPANTRQHLRNTAHTRTGRHQSQMTAFGCHDREQVLLRQRRYFSRPTMGSSGSWEQKKKNRISHETNARRKAVSNRSNLYAGPFPAKIQSFSASEQLPDCLRHKKAMEIKHLPFAATLPRLPAEKQLFNSSTVVAHKDGPRSRCIVLPH